MSTQRHRVCLMLAGMMLGGGCALLIGVANAQTPSPAEQQGVRYLGLMQDIRAQLIPHRQTTLAAEISAKIDALPVGEGASFAAGALLVRFDCGMQQAMLRRTRAELSGAEALNHANERLAGLNAIGQVEVEQSRAAVERAAADLGAQETMVSKCEIRAPFAGRLAERRVQEQQFVQPGEPLLDLIDDSALELGFLVPSQWLSWLAVGHRFEVLIDETARSYPVRLVRIGARIDPVSQSVRVVGLIDGRYRELVSGMSGTVRISPPAAQ
jgi:membrane fusion protein (multidrug efflux system)